MECDKLAQRVVWDYPYHDACATMLPCLHSVPWLEFSVWGSFDKLTAAPRPKKNNLASSVHKILRHFSLVQSTCSLKRLHFFNNGTLRGLFADSLASHWHFLIVTILTDNFRLSLITLELCHFGYSSIHLNGSFLGLVAILKHLILF